MNTVEKLRQTLAEQERLAPTGHDLLHKVHAAATFRLRRRRAAAAAACALTVLAVTAAVAFLPGAPPAGEPLGSTPTPSPSAALPLYRHPGEITLEVMEGSNYEKFSHGTVASMQFMTLRGKRGTAASFGGDIRVHDPGTYDASHLQAEEPTVIPAVTDNGFYIPLRNMVHPVLGWRDEASGAWVVITGDRDKNGLIQVAQNIRLLPPRQIKTGFHLANTPAGMHLTYISNGDGGPGALRSTVGFTLEPGLQPVGEFGMLDNAASVEVSVRARDEHTDRYATNSGATGVTGGALEVTYVSQTVMDGVAVPPGGTIVMIRDARCLAMVRVQNNARFPRAEQERLVAGFSFADCTQPATWVSPT